jgi:FkbM family methyltransferase
LAGQEISLPPEHTLPGFLSRYPLYDRYFLGFFKQIFEIGQSISVVDIGANVGDTAIAIISAAPSARVTAVEGSDKFLPFLRKNVAHIPGVRVVDAFVKPGAGQFAYAGDHGTGHLELHAGQGDLATRFVPVSELLMTLDAADVRIWKSDTDGYDIAILLSSYDEVIKACDVIWIEFDPVGNLSNPEDVVALTGKFQGLDREMLLFDNFGVLMFRGSCSDGSAILKQLTLWLSIQMSTGERHVYYLDLWVLPFELAELMFTSATSIT